MGKLSKAAERRLVREAGDLVAHYDALKAARRNVDLRMARLAREVTTRLFAAQGHRERYVWILPTRFLGRGMTLYARNAKGHWQTVLTPNEMSKATLEKMLDQGDAGFFHRPEDWGDTRYFDSFHSAVLSPTRWLQGADPRDGLAAIAAYAAKNLDGVSAVSLQETLERLADVREGVITRSLVRRIRHHAQQSTPEDREPPFIPTRILRFARDKGVGYGETMAMWLYDDAWGPGLPAREVKFLLNVNRQDQVRKMAREARRKLGGIDTMMRLVPPWPKESLSDRNPEPSPATAARKKRRRGGD